MNKSEIDTNLIDATESLEEISVNVSETLVDLLNRQEFVDRVIKIIELQSSQKKTSCFAINGKWGVGKSFVLNMLEEQLDVRYDEFSLFHYNCWQYDYYEEPLVAIVASMLDTIDEKENLIPTETKAKIKGFLKAVGSALLVKANEAIEKKTGFNPQEVINVITEAKEGSAEKIEEEHRYDSNFIFKATLKKLQETIKDLSNDKTIVFVVDELDRCLPEYAIKILERLHHVFVDIPNVQVILSIDKSQLEHIIKKTFGENTETQKYLSKFINFEVNLDEGSFSDNDEFNQKFEFYLQNFEYSNNATKEHQVDEFKMKIFDGIDMRSRIEAIEKCNLLHRLLNKDDEKSDFSIMCIEILFTLNQMFDFGIAHPNQTFNPRRERSAKNITPGVQFLFGIYQEADKCETPYIGSYNGKEYIRGFDIYGIIIACLRQQPHDEIIDNGRKLYDFPKIKEYAKQFDSLLKIIN